MNMLVSEIQAQAKYFQIIIKTFIFKKWKVMVNTVFQLYVSGNP